MNQKPVVKARVSGGNYNRLAIRNKTNMANKTFVENSVGGFAIVNGALRFSGDAGARGGSLGLSHLFLLVD